MANPSSQCDTGTDEGVSTQAKHKPPQEDCIRIVRKICAGRNTRPFSGWGVFRCPVRLPWCRRRAFSRALANASVDAVRRIQRFHANGDLTSSDERSHRLDQAVVFFIQVLRSAHGAPVRKGIQMDGRECAVVRRDGRKNVVRAHVF